MKDKAIAFLKLAQTELDAARHLFNGKFDAQALYFVSQASEKAVRAMAEEAGILIGTTHSFERMAAAFPDDHPFKSRIAEYDVELSSASTKTRYVTMRGSIFSPDPERVVFPAIVEAQDFVDCVKKYLSGNEFRSILKR